MNSRIPTRLLVALLAAVTLTGGLFAQADPPKPHYYNGVELVCVGIDDYSSAKVGKLNQAVADAKRFADALSTGYGISNKTMLLNKDATKKAILKALDDIDGRKQPPEAVIVYFAGHGLSFEYTTKDSPVPVRVGYLIPRDADVDLEDTSNPDEWEAEAIGMQWLVKRIEKMKSRHVVLVADACCSGFLTKRGYLSETPEVVALLTDPSRTILAATTQRQLASEGVFTTELIKQLEYGAKNVEALSVTDLFRKVRFEVVKASEKKMTPQMSQVGSGDGEFIFLPAAIQAEEVAKVKEAVTEAIEEVKKGKDGRPLNTAKLGAVRGVLEQKQKLAGRATTLADVCQAMDAPDYRYAVNAESEKKRWEGIKRRFEENAALGDGLAMAGLYFCYGKGLGVEKAPEKAYHWAQQASQVDKPAGAGAYFLGRSYLVGVGVPKNEVAAKSLFETSAKAGFILGELGQVEIRLGGPPLTKDEMAAMVKVCERGMEQRVAGAAHILAGRYTTTQNPDGKVNIPRAIELYAKGADWDSPLCMIAVYEGLREDRPGSPADPKRAEKYLRRAADAGSPIAQYALALEYASDNPNSKLNFTTDHREAFRWCKMAAAQGHAAAQVRTAKAYFNGVGTDTDAEAAKEWCEKAVKQNYSQAHALQGDWYVTGKVYGEKNVQKALEAYRRAADGKNSWGCYKTAVLLDTKKEFNPDWMEVLHYYAQAAKLGHFSSDKEAYKPLLDAYLYYVNQNEPEVRWPKFWEKYPESAREATRLLKAQTKRLDWFDETKLPKAKK
jgi:TPR repeat protein